MFRRILLTLAALAVAAMGVVFLDCGEGRLQPGLGDPIAVCDSVASLGGTTLWWTGSGLAVVAALALIAAWTPKMPGLGRRADPVSALQANMNRIPELGSEWRRPTDVLADELLRELERVERMLSSEDVSPREASARWIGLLRDANDLHNRDALSTSDFKEINTRLLALVSESQPAQT